MTKPEAKCGAVGMVEHVRDKLLTHAAMVKGRPVNEATLALLPSGEQCAQLAEWLGAALPELESACDERRTRSQQRVDGRVGRRETVKERVWWEVVACGRRYRSEFEDEARELMDLASMKQLNASLWRVVAVERTESVEIRVTGSPIAELSDGAGEKR